MNQFKQWVGEMKKDIMIPPETEEKVDHILKNLPKKDAVDACEKEDNSFSKKWRYRAVAAACVIILAVGSTVYASRTNFSLLSNFRNDSNEVKQKAEKMMDTNVKQVQTDGEQKKKDASKVSYWVTSRVKEAVCDKNTVLVEIEVQPKDGKHYLLKPVDAEYANDLGLSQEFDPDFSVEDYAKSLGKTSLPVGVSIETASGSKDQEMIDNWSIEYQMQPDGTVLIKLQFNNADKGSVLKYQYGVFVTRPDRKDGSTIHEYYDFEIEDKSQGNEVHYVPVKKNQPVAGTHLIVEDVEVEESDLSIEVKVTYRYTGETMSEKKWMEESIDGDVMFFYFDTKGKRLKDDGVYSGGAGGELLRGKRGERNSVYRDTMGLAKTELPDTLILRGRGVFSGKKWYGKVKVKKAES